MSSKLTASANAPPRPRKLSLEVKLPLFITLLLSVVLAVNLWVSHAEVGRAARQHATARLDNAAGVLALLHEDSVSVRLGLMREVAAESALEVYLLSGGPDAAVAARRTLERLRTPADSTTPVELLSSDGAPLLRLPRDSRATSFGRDELGAATAAVADSGGFGPLFWADGAARYWAIAPILSGHDRIGWIAQLRAFTPPHDPEEVLRLIGDDATFRIASTPGDFWLNGRGERVAPPDAWPFSGFMSFGSPGEGERLGHATPVPGTSWSVIVDLPASLLTAVPAAYLRRASAVAFVLLVLGGLAAWLVGRALIQPIDQLRAASHRIAFGHHDERVQVERGDEIGALAAAFNEMASQVHGSHRQLQMQLSEAQALASELVRANAQLREDRDAAEDTRAVAERASRAKSEFLATLSHEFRTPLNAVLGYADLLEIEAFGPLTRRQSDQLASIRASARHLMKLVDEVLDVAGIEAGRLVLEPRVALLEDAVESALAILRPESIRKGVVLTETCCDSNSFYVGDPKRVEQIIVNLVSNAVKFTAEKGRIRVQCRTTTSNGRGWSQVTIEDTGAGIAPDQLERIFEPFVQATRAAIPNAQGSVGLGLAISRRLARMMDGDILVESRPGGGSRFTVRLPAAEDNHAGERVDLQAPALAHT